MGQYYQPFNLDKKETICAHHFSEGLKLMETPYQGCCLIEDDNVYITNGYISALETCMNGRWKGDRVVCIGDYAFGDGDFDMILKELGVEEDPWESEEFTDISNEFLIAQDWHEARQTDFASRRYLLNDSRKIAIDIRKEHVQRVYEDANKSPVIVRIHPLTLLIAIGSDGRNILNNGKRIGEWAGESVSMADDPPANYELVQIGFNQNNVQFDCTDDQVFAALYTMGIKSVTMEVQLKRLKAVAEKCPERLPF